MNWFKKLSIEKFVNQNKSVECDHINNDRQRNQTVKKPTDNSSSGCSSAAHNQKNNIKFEIIDPDEFFEDPDHVKCYKEEAQFLEKMSEWVVVDTPTQEDHINVNFFSADFEDELVAYKSNNPSASHGYCSDNKRNTRTYLIIDMSWLRESYNIFWGHRISTGLPVKQQIFEPETKLKKSSILTVSSKTSSTSTSNNTICDILDKKNSKSDAIARSIMGALYKCTTIECDDCGDDDSDEFSDPSGRKDHYDIKQYFKLDDNGSILLDINHILEEKGYGFSMRKTKKLYRSIISGKIVDEDYIVRRNVVDWIKQLFQILRDIVVGHPRNKLASGGPGDSVRAYTLQLASDHSSTFSRNIENFISCTKESREAAPQVVMRNMRQFMNGMKNYLVKHGEGEFHQEVQKARSRLKSDEFLNIDAILEAVMHQLVVLPLREHLYGMFVDYYTRSGDIQLLVENVKYACARNSIEFGIRPTVSPPSTGALHHISGLLVKLQEAELPLDKLDLFLCVIAAIFDATGCPRGQQLGADDFLPILVYVVAKCGFVGAEIEAEFMWGLLQPALLSGEAGYYLTALCSAVHVLKSFMSSENEGTGSLDWRSSTLPACSSVLRVIIPDECNGSLQTRTLPVRPHTTTREVCRIIAHKARITNPQDYGLFKLVDGEETLLADTECPQDARIAARGKHCMLAYKRIDAKIAWPTATQPPYT